MCISVSQLVRNIDISVFAGIALTVEVDRKLRIATLARRYVHNPESQECTEDFMDSLKKKGNGHLGKNRIDTLDSSIMKKMAEDSEAKGKKPGSTCGLLG